MEYKTTTIRNFHQSIDMFHKLFILLCLLVGAFAEHPYLGLRVPVLGEQDIDNQIVGGSEAVRGQYPHQLSLQWGPSELSLQHFCGASILNEKWALTAGHCALAVPGYGVLLAKAGVHSLTAKESGQQTVKIARMIVHPDYSGGVAPFDLALLQLAKPLVLNKNVAAIGLPISGSEPTGDVILSGWGSISKSSYPIMPDKLQHVRLPVVDRPTCKRAIESLTGPSPLHQTNICSGPLSGGYSACSGDSGGPLIQEKNGRKTVVGVVSWGIIPCGTTGAPSVYVKVADFIDWIVKVMKN